MKFKNAYKYTKQFEGGYVNDPADQGRETFRGISRKNWPGWPGWTAIDIAKERFNSNPSAIDASLSKNFEINCLVENFYFENYWGPIASYALPDLLTAKLFDTSVHIGLSGGIRMLQRTLNTLNPLISLDVDGKYGPQTRQVAFLTFQSQGRETKALTIFSSLQAAYYKTIVEKTPGYKKFLKGWLIRAEWRPE